MKDEYYWQQVWQEIELEKYNKEHGIKTKKEKKKDTRSLKEKVFDVFCGLFLIVRIILIIFFTLQAIFSPIFYLGKVQGPIIFLIWGVHIAIGVIGGAIFEIDGKKVSDKVKNGFDELKELFLELLLVSIVLFIIFFLPTILTNGFVSLFN